MTTPTYTRDQLRRITLAKRARDYAARVLIDGMRQCDVAKIYGVTPTTIYHAVSSAKYRLERLVERDAARGYK